MAEDDLQAFKTWLDCNKLSMNLTKTFFLFFFRFTGNKSTQPQFDSLIVHNSTCKINACNCVDTIMKQKNAKYLGIIIDQNLRWDNQINNVATRLRKTLMLFKKLSCVLPSNSTRIFYYALIDSIINYGLLGWGGVTKFHLHKIIILQKKT